VLKAQRFFVSLHSRLKDLLVTCIESQNEKNEEKRTDVIAWKPFLFASTSLGKEHV